LLHTTAPSDARRPGIFEELGEQVYGLLRRLEIRQVTVARKMTLPLQFNGNPTGREVFMVVNLDTPVQIAELMYILTWFTGAEPTFTPIMRPEIYGEAIANAKKIIAPPK
jgi:hypothetical protein